MPLRHRHRVGRYLMTDDESGIVAYDDQIKRRWDGALVRDNGYETRHPQEFVRAKNDPKALKRVRKPAPLEVCLGTSFFVGNTTIPTVQSRAYQLFQIGIGRMTIGCDFQIGAGPGSDAVTIPADLVDDSGSFLTDDAGDTLRSG